MRDINIHDDVIRHPRHILLAAIVKVVNAPA